MPSVAVSPASPTSTVTVLSAVKVTEPPSVAVTRTVFAPPSSASEVCTLPVPVSASTVSVAVVGALSSSVSVIAASATVRPVAVPLKLIVSPPSASVSWVGVSVKSTCPLDDPAVMVIVCAPTVL